MDLALIAHALAMFCAFATIVLAADWIQKRFPEPFDDEDGPY